MIPSDLLAEVDALVTRGLFPDRESALREVLRLGLDSLRRTGTPGRPPMPPGVGEPESERPIDVKPWDVNWAP